MKIGGRVFQKNKIRINTDQTFCAIYKGCDVCVSTDHGFGKPDEDWLNRYNIEVTAPDGCYVVDTYEDLHDIRSAIIYALDGAKL